MAENDGDHGGGWSRSELEFVRGGIRDNVRSDGRSREDFRRYTLLAPRPPPPAETTSSSSSSSSSTMWRGRPPLIMAHGSAALWTTHRQPEDDGLHVACAVRADLVHPPERHPRRGILQVEVVVSSSHTSGNDGSFSSAKPRKPSAEDIWQQRLTQLIIDPILRSLDDDDDEATETAEDEQAKKEAGEDLRKSSTSSTPRSREQEPYDLDRLCLVPGLYVWRLSLEVMILQQEGPRHQHHHANGTLLDAMAQVMRAALSHTYLPRVVILTLPSTATTSTFAGPTTPGPASYLPPSSSSQILELLVDSDYAKARPPWGIVRRCPLLLTITVVACTSLTPGRRKSDEAEDPTAARGGAFSADPKLYRLVLDATAEEEACSTAQVHVALDLSDTPFSNLATTFSSSSSSSSNAAASPLGTTTPTVRALLQTGRGSLPWALLPDCVHLALKSVPRARQSFSFQHEDPTAAPPPRTGP